MHEGDHDRFDMRDAGIDWRVLVGIGTAFAGLLVAILVVVFT